MKFPFFFVFLLFSTYTLYSIDLEVHLLGIEGNKGEIFVGVFDSKVGFPNSGKALAQQKISVTQTEIVLLFKDLKQGTYAVAVFHDTNGNGKLDKNFFGIPREGIGFSNNASGSFGPPSFSSTAFELKKKNSIKIHMHY
jgi:uncharacterized protein (DUF2141 family)